MSQPTGAVGNESLAVEASAAARAPSQPADEGDSNLTASPPVARRIWPLLVLLTAIGPISFQIFLPALPSIQRGLAVSAAEVQLAVSLSMAAIAFAALAYGSVSDRFGRRPTLMAGMALLMAGGLICAAASSIGLLVFGRIVQAAGGAAGMVVTRAIVLDLYGRARTAQILAGLLAAMIVAPMLATPLGGLLADALGWRSNFLFVAILAALTLILIFALLPETRHLAEGGHQPHLLGDWAVLLRNRCFVGYAFQGAFAMAGFTTFMTVAPYVLQRRYGASATQVGLWFLLVSAGFALGSLAATRLPSTSRLGRRVAAGSAAALVAATLALALSLLDVRTAAALVVPAAFLAAAGGLTMPAAQAGAMNSVPALAGTASGLSGFLGTIFGAALSQLLASLNPGSPVALSAGMFGASLLAFLFSSVALRNHRSQSNDPPSKAE